MQIRKFIKQFESYLKQEAKTLEQSHAQPSKWAKIAQEAHDESPLHGLSSYVWEKSSPDSFLIIIHHFLKLGPGMEI